MKKIKAGIKHFKLDNVKKSLTDAGIHGTTVTEVKGFSRQKDHVELYMGARYEVNFPPKIKIEGIVAYEKEEAAVNITAKSARTGGVFCSCQRDCSILREKGRGQKPAGIPCRYSIEWAM